MSLFWLTELAEFPEKSIEFSFRDYMRHGTTKDGSFFFPAPAQIIARCEKWVKDQEPRYESQAMEELHRLREDREAHPEKYCDPSEIAEVFQGAIAKHAEKSKRILGANLTDEEWEAKKREMRRKAEEFQRQQNG